ncbi:MAG: hypothetical protein JWO19_6093 [Bryobacterales bacterium]|nr:hypothetical protein [Bryobacterales bacterium]
MLIAERFKFALLRGSRCRYRSARLTGLPARDEAQRRRPVGGGRRNLRAGPFPVARRRPRRPGRCRRRWCGVTPRLAGVPLAAFRRRKSWNPRPAPAPCRLASSSGQAPARPGGSDIGVFAIGGVLWPKLEACWAETRFSTSMIAGVS